MRKPRSAQSTKASKQKPTFTFTGTIGGRGPYTVTWAGPNTLIGDHDPIQRAKEWAEILEKEGETLGAPTLWQVQDYLRYGMPTWDLLSRYVFDKEGLKKEGYAVEPPEPGMIY